MTATSHSCAPTDLAAADAVAGSVCNAATSKTTIIGASFCIVEEEKAAL